MVGFLGSGLLGSGFFFFVIGTVGTVFNGEDFFVIGGGVEITAGLGSSGISITTS